MQRKRTAAIFLVLAMVISIAASAAPAPRYNTTLSCDPKISIRVTTATCSFSVKALSGTDISETLLKTWDKQSGATSLSYSDTYTVSRVIPTR